MIKYVFRRYGTLNFICIDSTIEGLYSKINRCYWNWKGIQEKGNTFTIDDFMKNKAISIIDIENIEFDKSLL